MPSKPFLLIAQRKTMHYEQLMQMGVDSSEFEFQNSFACSCQELFLKYARHSTRDL